jgi:hypothetical protein
MGLPGCARQASVPAAKPVVVAPSQLASATASANGVDLSVALAKVAPGRVEIALRVAVPGSTPVKLSMPDGSLARIVVTNANGKTAFDSAVVDQQAVASNPALTPDTSETMSGGSAHAVTYRANLAPGRYVLSATRLQPMVSLKMTDLVIR